MKKVFLFTFLAFMATLWNASMAQTNYDLFVGGIQVTSDNASNITGSTITSGTVSYDDATKTLTLNAATISPGDAKDGGIHNAGIDGLVINLVDSNTIADANASGITLKSNTTIKGENGSLVITSGNCGIYITTANTTLTISDKSTVEVTGKWGIAGKDGKIGETLVINNATVTAQGELGSIDNLADFRLEGSKITKPVGAVFNKDKGRVEINGEEVTTQVIIERDVALYPLFVGDVQVTSDNASNITSSNFTGSVNYDNETKTLTIDNVAMKITGHRGIYNKGIQDLIIKVLNTNSFETDNNNTGITLEASTTITGGGTLTIKALGMGVYLRANQTVLTVEGGTTLDIEGTYSITGKTGKVGETIIVKNSTVKAKGSNGSIVDLAALTLEDCEITQPVGAAFNPATRRVELNGEKVTEQVVIMPKTNSATIVNNNSGISVWSVDGMLHIKANENVSLRSLQIYNISGQLVRNIQTSGSETKVSLPAGTYIIKAGNAVEKAIIK